MAALWPCSGCAHVFFLPIPLAVAADLPGTPAAQPAATEHGPPEPRAVSWVPVAQPGHDHVVGGCALILQRSIRQ